MKQDSKNKQGSWIVVDGYSSGKHYAKLLNGLGIVVYHVQSMKKYWSTISKVSILLNIDAIL